MASEGMVICVTEGIPGPIGPSGNSDSAYVATGGHAARNSLDRWGEFPTVEDWRGYGGDSSDQAAMAAAVAACFTNNEWLFWPNKIYVSTASILNLHKVRHVGSGVIQRGTSTFTISPKPNSANSLFVSVAGTVGNDGLTVTQPMRNIKEALDALANYGAGLEGIWTINLAAGTYTGTGNIGVNVIEMRSRNPIIITGPVVPYPGIPTVIFQGPGNYGWEFDVGMDLDIRYVKFQNFTTSSGIVFEDKCRATLTQVHTFNCLIGIHYSTHCEIIYPTGIVNGNNIVGSVGLKSIYMNYHAIGDTGGGDPLELGPVIKKCTTGALVTENSTGHINAAFEDCNIGIDCADRSRVNFDNSNFKRNTIAVRGTINSDVWSADGYSFNSGTADKNYENLRIVSGALNLIYQSHAVSWMVESRDVVSTTELTGTTSETFIAAFAWDADRSPGAPNSTYIGKAVRITAAGEKTGTADAFSVLVRLHTAEGVGGTLVGGASAGVTDAGFWIFTALIDLVDADNQQGFTELRFDNNFVQLGRHSGAVNMADGIDRFFTLTARLNNASDKLTIDKFQVETLG